MSTTVTLEKMDKLLSSRFGEKQLAKIDRERAAENYASRKAKVDEIEKIEAEKTAMVSSLTEKYNEAVERHDLAEEEFFKARANMNALRRKRASVDDSKSRDAEKIRRRLRESCDAKIDGFITETYQLRNEVFATAAKHNLQKTDRPGKAAWSRIAEVFSTRPSLEAKVRSIDAAREAAIALQARATKDVDAELAKIRETIVGEIVFAKVGETEIAE